MLSNGNHFWLNGRLRRSGEAVISPYDRGLQVGHGAFETMHVHEGKVFAVTRHWQRLCQSCKVLGIKAPELTVFSDAVEETVAANGIDPARVRFTITRDNGEGEGSPTMVVTVSQSLTHRPAARVATVPWPRNEQSPLCGVKCLSYADNVLASEHASKLDADEAVFGNTRGELCEGATSNIFLVQPDVDGIATPPLNAGCLPGVIRGLVIELAEADGIQVAQRALALSTLSQAREAFLTSSTRYVQAVSHVDGQALFQSPGGYTRRLAELLKSLMAENPDP
ncbi:4-amino-4-deoxychorismate lyase [Phragmitibacter flavus]|uniref:branched-chain-amino-acid transaminase n=1 Tax=Phragmitibacter flavus TaxID=2576071 RepID=A0A5R8KFC7_9BACT|nr:aminotransferase class IV [Phragmitibacter flavus]TLD71008.1 4-amino-4-deoxychorismate lyase [Phragmitibacter flavus]